MKILIVDDKKEALYMLETLLRGNGYEVESASDGVEALEKVSRDGFDMIISDILMPQMDGFQLCREIKGNKDLREIAFVFYTATYTDPRDEEFALNLGAERFIIKPTEPDVFIKTLREVIKSQKAGKLTAPRTPVEDEVIYLKQYNERLIKKLEDKMLQLEEMNKTIKENLAQLSKKNRYETIIGAVTQSIHRSINLQDVLENAVEAMSKNIDGVNNVSIYLVEGEEAVLRAYRGYPSWWINRAKRIPYPKGFTWKTIIVGKPMYVADVDQDTVIGTAGREMGTKSYASMPIHFGGKTIGCININSLEKNAFDEEELKLLEIVVKQIEIAINNAQIAEAMRASEESLRSIIENEPECVKMLAPEGTVLQMNPAGLAIIEADDAEAIIGRSVYPIIAPEHRKAFRVMMESVLRGNKGKLEFEIISLKNNRRWLETNAVPIYNNRNEVIALLGVARDVTERKLAEEALLKATEQLRMLSRQLMKVQETERRHIARELHDEIGQALTAVKIDLEKMQGLDKHGLHTQGLEESIVTIDRTLRQVRNLSLDLRPSMLDDLGLIAALRWLIDRQAQRAGLIAEFIVDPLETKLEPELETVCFRTVQEALTNVVRHARAKHVHVELRKSKTELKLIIRDDGIGFDVSAAQRRALRGESFGLLSMQERVQLAGGQFEIKSKPKHGTTIRAHFPLTSPLSPKKRGKSKGL